MSDTALVHLTKISKAMAQARTYEDFRQVRAMAKMGLQALKRTRDARAEDRNELAEYVLRAERAMGQIIDKGQKNGEILKQGDNPIKYSNLDSNIMLPSRLEEAGVKKIESSRFKAIASIPDNQFEEVIQSTKEAKEELTQSLLLKTAKEAAKKVKTSAAREERLEAAAALPIHDSIIVGDFWENVDKIPDNSLSLIFTDPPYSKDTDLSHLADFAAKKLAKGGSLLFYAGHVQLPKVFPAFEGKLRYWWMCACVHGGDKALMVHYGIRVGWKPMLWFVKESRFDTQNIVIDTVSAQTEKDWHEWQQAEDEAHYWIEKLCPTDGIICDPYLGGATTAIAAEKLKRKWIGFEIDPEKAQIASGRLEKENDTKV